MKRYVVLDIEHRIDREAHARYLAAERFDPDGSKPLPAHDERATPRWPFRRAVAASWLVLTQAAPGEPLEPGSLHSFGMPEQDEAAILRALFGLLASLNGDCEIVTWGGASTDIPSLLLSASIHDVQLPELLRPLARPFDVRQRRHIDLMLALAGSAARVHLAEVAAALSIPAKCVAPPGAIAGLIERGKWPMVKAVAEADVFTTALLLGRYVGLSEGQFFGTADRIAGVAASQAHRPYAADFAAYRDRLRSEAWAVASVAYGRLVA